MDGNVIIKAVLDTVDVSKNIKALERDLQGISWKNIAEGDEKAAKLSSSFKKAGTAATVTLTAPVVAAGKAVFGRGQRLRAGQRPHSRRVRRVRRGGRAFQRHRQAHIRGWLGPVPGRGQRCADPVQVHPSRRVRRGPADRHHQRTHAVGHLRRRRERVHTRHQRPHGGLRAVRHRGQRPTDGGHAARPELHRRAGRQPERILRAMGRGGNERQRVLLAARSGHVQRRVQPGQGGRLPQRVPDGTV